jgi:hypothetical protein
VREYWQERVAKQGLNAVSTVGNINARTVDEIEFLTEEILKIYPEPVDLAIDFGAGWGRLLPVMKQTSKRQILVDFIDENKRLCRNAHPLDDSYKFIVSSINDFQKEESADYALSSFLFLHIINDNEYRKNVSKMIDSVKDDGHLFVYESYNESGKVASHCSSRNREQFLGPFNVCALIKEKDWQSKYQPYETNCHQPIKLFIFRK